nr:MAG TPA: hypothetical protein [Caudoviricetes sp.]
MISLQETVLDHLYFFLSNLIIQLVSPLKNYKILVFLLSFCLDINLLLLTF